MKTQKDYFIGISVADYRKHVQSFATNGFEVSYAQKVKDHYEKTGA